MSATDEPAGGAGERESGHGSASGAVWIVDGANVVGSRPDGWWRDRPGAAGRLYARLSAASGGSGPAPAGIVLVLEGQARAGVAADAGPGPVRVVHAPGSGDDTIVEQAREAVEAAAPDGRPVLVVTADRGLRARVAAVGATSVGPGWLWEHLDEPAG